MEDSDEVCKYSLPNTQLKFVQEIHNEEGEKVQPKLRKGWNERALDIINNQWQSAYPDIEPTYMCGGKLFWPNTLSMAFELTTYPFL